MENQYDVIVSTIFAFYKNTNLLNYRLPLAMAPIKRGKGGREIGKGPNASDKSKQFDVNDSIRALRIDNVFSYIPDKEPLELMLKKAVNFKFMGIKKPKDDCTELKDVTELLRKQISLSINENEIKKKQEELKLLEDKILEISNDENDQQSESENTTALKALKILAKNDNNSKILYLAIREKLLPNTQFNFDEHIRNHASYSYKEKHQQQNTEQVKTEKKEDVYVPPHVRNVQISYGERKNTETNETGKPGLFTKLAETNERLSNHSGYNYNNNRNRDFDNSKREKWQYYNEVGRYYVKDKKKQDNYVSLDTIVQKSSGFTEPKFKNDEERYPFLPSSPHEQPKTEETPKLSKWLDTVKFAFKKESSKNSNPIKKPGDNKPKKIEPMQNKEDKSKEWVLDDGF